MPDYRRRFRPGGTYFFTIVTEGRVDILCTDRSRKLLHDAIEATGTTRPFILDAIVLLPDHLHLIMTLPDGDADYPTRIAAIKAQFTRAYLDSGGQEQPRPPSRLRHRNRGVWQRRFWEHCIRDADDLERHMHYIHYNPVKHGLAACPHFWQYSSFQKWVSRCAYEPSWLCTCDGQSHQRPTFIDLPGAEADT